MLCNARKSSCSDERLRGVRPTTDRGQTWETFLKNHTDDIWACDFLQLYDIWFRPIFAFFIVKHGSREVVHFNVTRSPGDEWVAQQWREATPFATTTPSSGVNSQRWPTAPIVTS